MIIFSRLAGHISILALSNPEYNISANTLLISHMYLLPASQLFTITDIPRYGVGAGIEPCAGDRPLDYGDMPVYQVSIELLLRHQMIWGSKWVTCAVGVSARSSMFAILLL